MIARLRQFWLAVLYYLSWFWFGFGGLLINLVCLPLLLLPGSRERFGHAIRTTTRWMFDSWIKWLHTSGVVRVNWHGFDRPLPAGLVYVANHPSLIDAPCLLARLPDTVCIFKPALLRNPVIGPAALISGYVSAANQGVDLVREAASHITGGQSLLIFPEGTRTAEGTALNPLRSGFALIAARAGCAVQIIRVQVSPRLVRKERPWWHIPPLPGWIDFTLDERFPVGADTDLEGLIARVETRLRSAPATEAPGP